VILEIAVDIVLKNEPSILPYLVNLALQVWIIFLLMLEKVDILLDYGFVLSVRDEFMTAWIFIFINLAHIVVI
jgi:hypothetical protein